VESTGTRVSLLSPERFLIVHVRLENASHGHALAHLTLQGRQSGLEACVPSDLSDNFHERERKTGSIESGWEGDEGIARGRL